MMMKKLLLSSLMTMWLMIPNWLTAQWQRQYPLPKLDDINDIVITPDGYGYAAGADDILLKLNTSTQSWEFLPDVEKGWTFLAIDCLEGSQGNTVAAGGAGLLLSQDGGHAWSTVAGAPPTIHHLKILPSTHVIVIASGGVYRWDNTSWVNLNAPVTSNIAGGYILDDQRIWFFTTGTTPVMYYTTNGGGMWNQNTEITRPDVVRFYNANYGICLDDRKVYQSLNGGQHWTQVSNGVIHNSASDITFGSSPNVMMAATLNADPALSLDSGRTWVQQDMGLINQRNFSVASSSDSQFWMGNDLTGIAHTTDAGNTWQESCGPKRKLFYDTYFINRSIGFTVGTEGSVLRTLDGGVHWEDVSFEPTRINWAVQGNAANDVWMGSNQRIYQSVDTGATWIQKGVFAGGNINDILALSATRILACSSSGIIYRTTNGGMKWDTVYQTNGQIRSLAKIGNQRIMATGFNGLILRSENQGDTWTPLTAPEAGLQYEQSFFHNNDGWLITSSFKKTMWHTTNAGDTWDPITLPIDRFWQGVYFITKDTGVVVCNSNTEGRAYITFNGGMNWQSGYITSYPLYGVTGVHNPNGTAWIHGYGSDIEVLPYCSALPVINNFSGPVNPCENDTVTYSITSQDVDQFYWLFPSGWQVIGNGNNDTVQVRIGRNSGNISVTGTNACGFSSPITIGTGPILLPDISGLTGPTNPCESTLITLNAVASDVDNFSWTFPGPDWQVFGNANEEDIMVFAGETPGTVSVVGSNTCGTSDVATLNINPKLRPRLTGISGNEIPCTGTIEEYVATAQFYDAVSWTFPADWTVLGPSDEPAITVLIGDESGKVSAVAENECGESALQELVVTAQFVPPAAILPDAQDTSLVAQPAGASYQWFLNGVLIPGATEQHLKPSVSGSYTVTIVYAGGCTSTSFAVQVVISATDQTGQTDKVFLYPVPASDQLHIRGIEGAFHYTLTDLRGNVADQNQATKPVLDLSRIQPGLYVLTLVQGDQRVIRRIAILR